MEKKILLADDEVDFVESNKVALEELLHKLFIQKFKKAP